MLPNYLVIGVARGGTSWIARNLGRHPDVFMHQDKELHFFDKNYEKGVPYYEALFGSPAEKAVGEATPAYLYREQVPPLIEKHLPGVRLIVTLRDPTERAYSHYLNLLSKSAARGRPQLASFESALDHVPRLLKESLYFDMLERYFRLFGPDRILIVLFDELCRSPRSVLSRIFDFLGVDPDFDTGLAAKRFNASGPRLMPNNVIRSMYELLERFEWRAATKKLETMVLEDGSGVAPDTRDYLIRNHFLEQLERLETVTGLDLGEWKRLARISHRADGND